MGKLATFLKPQRQPSLDLSPEHTASLPIRPLQATEEGEVLAVAPMSGLGPNPQKSRYVESATGSPGPRDPTCRLEYCAENSTSAWGTHRPLGTQTSHLTVLSPQRSNPTSLL